MPQKKKSIIKYAIYLNGKYKGPDLEDKLVKHDNIYVADGGLRFVLKNKIPFKKMFWVGDGDSLNKQSKKFLTQASTNSLRKDSVTITRLNKDKDLSDFAVILDTILRENKNNKVSLNIYYGLGGRMDHEHANLLEAAKFLKLLPQGGICYFNNRIILSSLEFSMTGMKNKNFSIFAESETQTSLRITGAYYSGKILLERPSHGLSNEGKKDKVTLHPEQGSIFRIYT